MDKSLLLTEVIGDEAIKKTADYYKNFHEKI